MRGHHPGRYATADRVPGWLAIACTAAWSLGGCIRYDVPDQPDLSGLVAGYAHPTGEVDAEVLRVAVEASDLAETVAWGVWGLELTDGVDRAMEGLDPLIAPSPEPGPDGSDDDPSLSLAGLTLGGSGSVRVAHPCDGALGGHVHATLSIRQTRIESVASGQFVRCDTDASPYGGRDPGADDGPAVRLDGGFAVDLGGGLALGEGLAGRGLTFRFDGQAEVGDAVAMQGRMDFQTGPDWVAVRIEHPRGGHVIKVVSRGEPRFAVVGAGGVYECHPETKECTGPDGPLPL